ncbi:hypothetical protein PoB_004000200 [Plakobranchus ocellatus]|uniref:Uncharacterized protein n=1 Tax=Plakobranchus ocellatus TaxID=259542 RepID=A0AAV4B2Q3_9GAST|nr:hypothetical protein PoB_004000200 [Plakobranchus ocellatus]
MQSIALDNEYNILMTFSTMPQSGKIIGPEENPCRGPQIWNVALDEPREAHPKPTHCRLPFSTGSFASPVEVFAQVGEHFVELVCSLSIPISLPDGVDASCLQAVWVFRKIGHGRNLFLQFRVLRDLAIYLGWVDTKEQ